MRNLYFELLAKNTTSKLEKQSRKNAVAVKYDNSITVQSFDYKKTVSSIAYVSEKKEDQNSVWDYISLYLYQSYNDIQTARYIPTSNDIVTFADWTYTNKYLDSYKLLQKEIEKEEKAYQDSISSFYNFSFMFMYLYPDENYLPVQDAVSYEWKYQGKKRKEYTRQETLSINDENIRSVAIMATKSALDCMYGNKAQGTEKMYQSLMDDKASANKAIYLLDDINNISDNVCKVVTHTKKLLDGKYVPIIPWTEIKNSINGVKVDELLDAVTDISTNNNYLALFGSAYLGIYEYLAENPACENVLECIPTARNSVQRWIDNHRNFAVKTYSYQVPQKDDNGNTVFENDENMLNQANFYSGKNSTDFIGNVEQDIMLAWYIDELVSYDKENIRDLDRTILQALILNPDMTRTQIAEYLGIEKKILNSAIKRLQRIQQKYSIIPNYNSDFHIFKK